MGLSHEDLQDVQRVLTRAVRARCPRELADRADDIVQEAMIKVMRLSSEGKGSLQPSYLWKVAWSATIDELRRHRRRREDALEDVVSEPIEQAPVANPEGRTHAQHVAVEIQDCLGRLVENRRRALTLHLVGHTVPETAKLLGWTPKKAENHVYRGLADLRDCLTKKGVTP
ncbi:MAG: RNA polymerase sigma factor [Proteobacteria bacterium]|nr:RNA polymerase sigma factor [Pseudomonadota bacterium]